MSHERLSGAQAFEIYLHRLSQQEATGAFTEFWDWVGDNYPILLLVGEGRQIAQQMEEIALSLGYTIEKTDDKYCGGYRYTTVADAADSVRVQITSWPSEDIRHYSELEHVAFIMFHPYSLGPQTGQTQRVALAREVGRFLKELRGRKIPFAIPDPGFKELEDVQLVMEYPNGEEAIQVREDPALKNIRIETRTSQQKPYFPPFP